MEEIINPGLEEALAMEDGGDAKDSLVLERLADGDVYTLGKSGEDQQIQDLLSVTTQRKDGRKVDVAPVFTRLSFLQPAVEKNPDWARFNVLRVSGHDLLEAVDAGALVVNPWSKLEYQLSLRQFQPALTH